MPSTAEYGAQARWKTYMVESTTAMMIPWRTPMSATPSAQATASDELGLADAIEPPQLGDVEQGDRGRDDDRRQDRLGHRLDEARHDEQHREHEAGGHQTGQLGLRAGLERDGGPGAAGAHREAREQAGGEVRGPDAGELLVAVDLVAAT